MTTTETSTITEDDYSAPNIVVTCQQTRFHISETDKSIEVDIADLNLAIVPPNQSSSAKKVKGKGVVGHEIELLSHANLRLKSGIHYALMGRNGTGKSTILRALAERIIPGLPPHLRVALLQQTSTEVEYDGTTQRPTSSSGVTVLQHVIESDRYRSNLLQEIGLLTGAPGKSDDASSHVRRYRQLKYDRLSKELLEVQNNAHRRSGARGLQARKDLIAFEKEVEAAKEALQEDIDAADSSTVQEEFLAASSLLVDLQSAMESVSLVDLEIKAREVLTGLGFSDLSIEKPVDTLSGGWRMRCDLASVLVQQSDIMILDEPTNFLDLLGIIWLQKYLVNLRDDEADARTIVLVSHDRDFIDTIVEEVIILRDQKLEYHRGNLSEYEDDLRSRILFLSRMQENQDKEAARIQKTIRENIKLGKKTGDDNKLRMAKSRANKLEESAGMQRNANGNRFKKSRDRLGKHITKHAEIEIPKEEQGVTITMPMAPDLRFPGALVSLEDVSYRYSGKLPNVLQDISLSIHIGDRVGVVGLNGSGKSTLIKIATEMVRSTKGIVTRHPRLKLAYYSQNEVENLQALGRTDMTKTALGLLAAETAGEMNEQEMRGLLGSFGLQGRTASDVPISKLSGGQLVRLGLVRILWNHPNLLVLDEVTTHLDYRTVLALIDALSVWNGAILLVSHDRYLVRRVIEGEKHEDLEDEDDGRDRSEEPEMFRRAVYVLRDGKMKLQAAGISSFEKSLEKRVAKMIL